MSPTQKTAKLPPRFLLSLLPGVPAGLRRVIQPHLDQLERCTAIQHRISISLVPGEVVESPDGGLGFAAIWLPPSRRGEPQIFVAAQKPRLSREFSFPVDEWRHQLLRSLFHEVVHYEQWRDGRPVIERGVEVRARNLLKQTTQRLRELQK